jgi:hypothetical protein
MGVVTGFARMPADVWPAVLPRIRAAGITVEDHGLERGLWWYTCTRGPCWVGLGYDPEDHGQELIVYCPAARVWWRPLGTWRLLRDVRRAVQEAGGQFT